MATRFEYQFRARQWSFSATAPLPEEFQKFL
jgi:hypothetical protein